MAWSIEPAIEDSKPRIGDWVRVVDSDSGRSLGEGVLFAWLTRMPCLPEGARSPQYRIGTEWCPADSEVMWCAPVVRHRTFNGLGELIPGLPACPDCSTGGPLVHGQMYTAQGALRRCRCGSLFALSPWRQIPANAPQQSLQGAEA